MQVESARSLCTPSHLRFPTNPSTLAAFANLPPSPGARLQFAQELLQTFSTTLGEVSLQPSTGGVFKVDIYHSGPSSPSSAPSSTAAVPDDAAAAAAAVTTTTIHTPLWDRATDGGFPETKELKRRLRDVVEPGRNLGHVDRDYHPRRTGETAQKEEGGEQKMEEVRHGGVEEEEKEGKKKKQCEDCA